VVPNLNQFKITPKCIIKNVKFRVIVGINVKRERVSKVGLTSNRKKGVTAIRIASNLNYQHINIAIEIIGSNSSISYPCIVL